MGALSLGESVKGAPSPLRGDPRPWIAYAIVASLTIVIYSVVLQLWNADPHVLAYYADHGDVLYNLAFAKGLFEYGNPYFAPLSAAPLGGQTYDFPVFCAAQLPVQLLLGWISGSGVTALNFVYLLSLPMAAAAALFAMRQTGVGTWLAIPLSVVFALEPRFLAGERRLDVPVFWIIPLSALMCMIVARGDFTLIERHARRAILSKDSWVLLVAAALTGLGNQYYAFFAVVLLGVAAVIGTVKAWSPRPIIVSLALGAIVIAGVGLQFTPSLFFQFQYGRNAAAVTRYPEEAQRYALQIASLILPIEAHRGNPWFANARSIYDTRAPFALSEVSKSSLGAIGAIGFLALLAALVVRVGRRLPHDLDSLSLLNVAAVLLSTSGAFGALFNFYVNPGIRAYNRISLFIAFFALAGLAQIITSASVRLKRRIPLWGQIAAAIAVVAFAAWDQTTPDDIPPYALSKSEFQSDATFVAKVEAQIGSGAAFELPWMRFPESVPVGTLLQGDLYRPYLFAKTLHVSYGAVEGRDPYDWQKATGTGPVTDMIRSSILGGFDGFIVFRQGYSDNGATLEKQFRAVLGQPIESPDTTLAFYSTKALRERLVSLDPRIGDPWFAQSIVRSVVPIFGSTFVSDVSGAGATWDSTAGTASILLWNRSDRTRPVAFSAGVDLGPKPQDLAVVVAGQHVVVAATQPSPRLYFRFDAPPGKSTLRLATTTAAWTPQGKERIVFRLADPQLVPLDIGKPNKAASAALLQAMAALH